MSQKSTALNTISLPLNQVNLIEASAGTGKTYTIGSIYLRLLLQAGIFVAQQCPVSQQVGNVCSQYTDIEGFHNIFIRSALQSLDDILVGIQCCEQDDGDM